MGTTNNSTQNIMATRVTGLGSLDSELEAKQRAKYDAGEESKALSFIKSKTGHNVPKGANNVAMALKDGEVLVALANACGGNIKYKKTTMTFKQLEALQGFCQFCRSKGVPDHAMMVPVDLADGKDMHQVILCINTLSLRMQGKGGITSNASRPLNVNPNARA